MFFSYEEIKEKHHVTYEELKSWCDENLESEFVIGNITVYFELESDAMAFKIRWL